MYGTEFNGDLGYSSGGLFAGLSYGVLFPLGAMNHPSGATAPADKTLNDYGFGNDSDPINGATNIKDAETAHTIQARVVLSF
jgi:hypothetical protein